ncbi:MAG: hypothetical protein IJH67_11450 [Thermoguttaceae bacterium]|nr:hypothetical protein [Thermoguttaceae bacterium]
MLPHFLDGGAVKKDSEGGVHPREVFGCVGLVCTPRGGLRKRPTGAGIIRLARQRGLGAAPRRREA